MTASHRLPARNAAPKAESGETSFFKPDIPDTAIYHVGVSGGKDSGAVLMWLVKESGIPPHRINATFCDTGNEHAHTYRQVEILSSKVHPIEVLKPELDFWALSRKKHRFPSTKVRFCTQFLKIYPTQDHIGYLKEAYRHVVAVSGVRSGESVDRAKLLEWDYSGNLLTIQWRPIITWSLADVLAIHQRYGIPMNPLYAAGAKRVGCFPCIMSNKPEIRMIAQQFPERIDMIRREELAMGAEHGRVSSFFQRDKVPERFRSREITTKEGERMRVATIDDVVQWSMTGKRARGSYLDDVPEPVSCGSGFCE